MQKCRRAVAAIMAVGRVTYSSSALTKFMRPISFHSTLSVLIVTTELRQGLPPHLSITSTSHHPSGATLPLAPVSGATMSSSTSDETKPFPALFGDASIVSNPAIRRRVVLMTCQGSCDCRSWSGNDSDAGHAPIGSSQGALSARE